MLQPDSSAPGPPSIATGLFLERTLLFALRVLCDETHNAMEYTIRLFTPGDIEFALAQTTREGWDTAAEFFPLCVTHDPHGCFIAEHDGHRAGMITTTRYARTAWIGNLIVPPEHRHKGIGALLMKHTMTYLFERGVETIRREADLPGVKLYRRLGFGDEFESLRFERRPAGATAAGSSRGRLSSGVETIQTASRDEVTRFDAEYFGDDRSSLLDLLIEGATATYAVRSGGRLGGYAAVQPSASGLRIGPWIAPDREEAECLLGAVLDDFADKTLAVGVPSVNIDAVAMLESHGFRKTPSSLRMVFGQRTAVGRPERVFGIANGAMG